jgi:hypothetical protein
VQHCGVLETHATDHVAQQTALPSFAARFFMHIYLYLRKMANK